jgi:hypothetical protein
MSLLTATATGIAMNQTKSENRVIVLGRTAPASEKTAHRVATDQRPTTHRIVVIRNGELVAGRTGR